LNRRNYIQKKLSQTACLTRPERAEIGSSMNRADGSEGDGEEGRRRGFKLRFHPLMQGAGGEFG